MQNIEEFILMLEQRLAVVEAALGIVPEKSMVICPPLVNEAREKVIKVKQEA